MTHGVISSTANLVYQDEPGALNESFADVFGVLIENEDFRLGEEVVNTRFFPSGALRNVADPNQGGNSLNDPAINPPTFLSNSQVQQIMGEYTSIVEFPIGLLLILFWMKL